MNITKRLEFKINSTKDLNVDAKGSLTPLVTQAILLDFMETYCVADVIIDHANEVI